MGKRLVQGVLLVAIFLMLPVSVVGIWVRAEIVDSDTFVASVQDLPANSDVQAAIVQAVGNTARAHLTMDWATFVTATVSDPAVRAQLLPLNVDVPTFVEEQTRVLMQRAEITPVWVAILRTAHPLVKDVLLGKDSAAVKDAAGNIRLDLGPIYTALVASLAKQGVDVTRVLPAQEEGLSLTIYHSDSLQQVQRVARLVERWAIPLVVIAGVLAILVVVISQRKALAGAIAGLTVLMSMAALLVSLSLAIRFVLDRSLESVQRDAALAVIRDVTASLREWALVAGVAGAVVMVVCLFAQSLVHRQTRTVYKRR